MPVIQRVNKHYFVTSMIDHETVNYSQDFVTLTRRMTCRHLPSYVDEYIWQKRQHDVEGMFVVFWLLLATQRSTTCVQLTTLLLILLLLLSPSPSRNPETDNKQTEVRFLIQLNSTQLTTPKEKSGLQEERSYKSLYKSPILQ